MDDVISVATPLWQTLLPYVVTMFCGILASGGLWALIMKLMDRKDVKRKMLLGVAHDRLVYLCMQFIDRGWLTKEEYENAYKYLYLPYKEMGGNGTIDRLVEEMNKLPIKPSAYYKESGGG
jgi:hypothetical protein